MRTTARAMNAYCSSCGQPLATVATDEEARGDELCLQCERRSADMLLPPRDLPEIASPENLMVDHELPDSDLDGFPEGQAADDGQPAEPASPSRESFNDLDREEAHRRLLRARGLDLEYDPHGFRLKRAESSRNSSISELSPSEIVRLAAEIDGEVVPPEERIRCPNCEAVVSPNDRKCQWCSHVLGE